MSGLLRGVAAMLALLVGSEGGAAEGQERVTVTVRQLFDQGHRLEVAAGSEIVGADPHFDRIWFSAGAESPKVERRAGGFQAVFEETLRRTKGDKELTTRTNNGARRTG